LNKKNYMVIDFGASSGRVSVAGFDGNSINFSEIHRFENRPVQLGETLFWDFLRLYSELEKGIQAGMFSVKEIISVGIDSWGDDFGLIDKNGMLISNPIHYRDDYRNSLGEQLYAIIPQKELFRITGGQLATEVGLFGLYGMVLKDATELKAAERLLMIPDLFNYFLTGYLVNEFTVATTALMFNTPKKRWAYEIFDKIGIPEKLFQDVISPGHDLGPISSSVSKRLDIRPLKVIVPCTHDTASAVTGIPVLSDKKKWGFISMGTWCILGMESNDLIIDDSILGTGFFNEGGAEDKNLFVKDINGMWIMQQCKSRWEFELNREIGWQEIDKLASEARPLSCFINVDAAEFTGMANDMPNAVREFCKNTGQTVPSSIGEITRCVYESLALRFRYDIARLEMFSGTNIEILHLVGGGINNRLLCQWTANSTGKNIIAGPAETTSVGNLIMQLKVTGQIRSVSEGRKIVLESFHTVEYSPAERNIWDSSYERYLKII